ncbi:hypothetical protein F4803DRAFT_441167 [Xylaria telfairii]|nr:hypothetical protein F4803DRAFT_441167 [Xylaria telfairii]
MYFSTLTALAFGCANVLATPTPIHAPRSASLPLPARTIFQLDDTVPKSWFENIALRQNGDLLVTMLQPYGSVYSIKGPLSGSPKSSIINIPNANGVLGIAETSPDVFIVASGNFSALATPVPGTMAVWEINLRGLKPTTRLVTKIPEAALLNGITTVSDCSSPYVLIADSGLSRVWRVDVKTGQYETAAEVPEMQPIANATLEIGVNGVKTHDGHLYFSNSNYASIYRLPIDKNGVAAKGAKAELAASFDASGVDDFQIDERGNFWTATFDNSLAVAKPGSTGVVVDGKLTELTVAGNTALAFGRTKSAKNLVFVVTGGAQAAPVNGTITEPAKIVAIDRTGFQY